MVEKVCNWNCRMPGEERSKKRKLELLEMSQPVPPCAATFKAVNELLIPYIADMLQSYDKSGWLPATMWFHELLSGLDPPIAKVLQCDVLTSFLLFLTDENIPQLQVEAAKALKLAAYGTCDEGHDPLQPMYSAQDTIRCVLHTRDDEVLFHACCSLAVLSGCENVKIGELIRASHVEVKLFELVFCCHKSLVVAALRTLGNIIEGDANLIGGLINVFPDTWLPELRRRLFDECIDVRKEACWLISYIVGTEHGKQVVHEADLIKPLVSLIKYDKMVVMAAAVHAISKATSGATPEQIRSMVASGCIDVLCILFCCRNNAIFNLVLHGIEAILEAGENEKSNPNDVNTYAEYIRRIDGWFFLEMSATNYEKKLLKRIYHVLIKYGPNSSGHKTHMEHFYSSDDE